MVAETFGSLYSIAAGVSEKHRIIMVARCVL